MNSRTTIKFYLVIVGIVVVAGLIALAIIYEEDIKKLGATEISIEIVKPSTPSEENMTFIASYETSIPFAESGIHNRIFIVHDNKRNVTCYIHHEGISCISDCYIENQNV